MGMDPEARLAYGYALGTGEDFKVAERAGYGNLSVDWWNEDGGGFETQAWKRLWDAIPEKPEVEHEWKREDAARKHWGVDIVNSGTYDYPGFILVPTEGGSYKSVEWSDSMTLDVDVMRDQPAALRWDATLAAALQVLGLTPTQDGPKWLVFPFYG
jgi:hypothetical protein